MDFLDPKKRRRDTILLLIGYVLVGIAVLMATVVLIYYANGFGVDKDGALVQRGLVFVSSEPSGSDIYLNGIKKTNTNAKLNLSAGHYNLAIKRSGYVSWNRKIIVEGSSIDHYAYPLLLPKSLEAGEVSLVESKPILTTQSPNKRWLLVQFKSGDNFQLYDFGKSQVEVGKPESIVLPDGLVSASTTGASWQVLEWASNNRHVLMRRNYATVTGEAKEYILLDRQRLGGSHNLTREFSLQPNVQISLRDKDPELYFAYEPDKQTLNTVSLGDKELSILQTNVLAFNHYGRDVLLYATDDGASDKEARIIFRDNKTSFYIRSVSRSNSYLLDVSKYDGKWLVAAGSSVDSRVFLYQNPEQSINANSGGRPTVSFVFSIPTPTNIAFSANSQMLAVQNGTSLHVYDAEYTKAYRYKTPATIDGPDKVAGWMDSYRFTYVNGGKQVVFDFDGINYRALTAADPSIGGFFDSKNVYMYSFVTSTDTGITKLYSTPLRTPEDL